MWWRWNRHRLLLTVESPPLLAGPAIDGPGKSWIVADAPVAVPPPDAATPSLNLYSHRSPQQTQWTSSGRTVRLPARFREDYVMNWNVHIQWTDIESDCFLFVCLLFFYFIECVVHYICLLQGRDMVGYGQVPVSSDNSVEQTFLVIFCGLVSHEMLSYLVFVFPFLFVYLSILWERKMSCLSWHN